MSAASEPQPIAIVTACMTAAGLPTFVLTTVAVTADERANGIHYYLAEAELLDGGYEEPYVHFDQLEMPPFLHAAVRQQLVEPPDRPDPRPLVALEKP